MPRPGLLATMRGAGGGALEVAYGSAGDDPANATTYTFTDMPIGTASATRTVVAVIGLRATSSITVSGVTIGGVSATIDLSQANADNTAYTATVVARATVPTGTTATVVASTSACIRALAATYVIGGGVAVAGTATSNAAAASLTLSAATGPVVIAAQSEGANATLSITSGATADAALVSSESGLFRMIVGHSTASPATVTFGTLTGLSPASVAIAYEAA